MDINGLGTIVTGGASSRNSATAARLAKGGTVILLDGAIWMALK